MNKRAIIDIIQIINDIDAGSLCDEGKDIEIAEEIGVYLDSFGYPPPEDDITDSQFDLFKILNHPYQWRRIAQINQDKLSSEEKIACQMLIEAHETGVGMVRKLHVLEQAYKKIKKYINQ